LKNKLTSLGTDQQFAVAELLFLAGALLSLVTKNFIMGAIWLAIGLKLIGVRLFASRQ
jgi:hypothetical protein